MIGIFADQNMGQQTRPGASAFDRARWQLCLGEAVAARTGKAGPGDAVHDEAPWHVFQLFGHILAQAAQLATTIRTGIMRTPVQ